MNAVTLVLYEIQETTLMAARAFTSAFKRPFYVREILQQMDIIGVGSLVIVLLTGFFTGAVLALQTGVVLKTYGVLDYTGQLVMTTMVRALGPVLTALMLAGRVGSGIAAELGSMVVTEQIDALRALSGRASSPCSSWRPRSRSCATSWGPSAGGSRRRR
jgi:phospholipid/cholesterol/gamma-HCH transport system permease protein